MSILSRLLGKAYGLDSEFKDTKPVALVLLGQSYTVGSWGALYRTVCRAMAGRDPNRFAKLPDDLGLRDRKGKPLFAYNTADLRDAREILLGILAEVNLSANSVRDYTIRLLTAFAVPIAECRIYLRNRKENSGPDI